MDDIELLDAVLAKTATILDGVTPDERDRPTPCTHFDVGDLVNHVTGFAQAFATGAHGDPPEEDPTVHEASDDPAAEFRSSAAKIVTGWRTYGVDRTVGIMRSEMPGKSVLAMTVTEYLAHGWDLATATEQPIPYTEAECARALSLIEDILPPQYRGDGQPFGEVVSVPDDAPAVDRFVAFLGRDPH